MGKFLKVLGVIFLVLIVLIGSFLTWAYFATADSREVGEAFVAAIHEEDLQKAYAMLDSRFQAEFSFEQFADLVESGNLTTIQADALSWNAYSVDLSEGTEEVHGNTSAEGNIDVGMELKLASQPDGQKPTILMFNFYEK